MYAMMLNNVLIRNLRDLSLLDYSMAKKKREKSMMTCERCGKEMPDNMAICPSCGTITSAIQGRPQPPTNHGPYPSGGPPMGGYEQGYSPQPGYMQPPQPGYPPLQQGYMPPPQQGYMQPPQPNYGYGQSYGNVPYPGAVNVNIVNAAPPPLVGVNVVTAPSTNNSAVLVEVLLSIFLGIYGVGWLMSGETTIGVVLLVCSFLVYWPVLIFGTILTLGIGLLCLGPLAIGAIIFNAIMLNNAIKRKASVQIIMSQPR